MRARLSAIALLALELAGCADAPVRPHGRYGDYYPLVPNTGIALAAIATPSSGSAPSGATQLTGAGGTITSCPTPGSGQQLAAQVTTAPGQNQSFTNSCTVPFYLYPASGGVLSGQATNAPLLMEAGATILLFGRTSTSTGLMAFVHNYEWVDVTSPFTIPAMAAFTCAAPISITEAKAVMGDSIIATGTSALPSDNIAVSFEVSVSSAGTIQIKPCNIANTGLGMSTAISGAALALKGLGLR